MLDILGLADEFEVVVTRDDVEHGKPGLEMHLLVARKLDVEPEECLNIEGSPAGVKAALAGGRGGNRRCDHRSHAPEVPRHQSLGPQPRRGRTAYAAYVVRRLISAHGQPLDS